MPRVELTAHLRRFFPDLDVVDVTGGTVAQVIGELDLVHPGLAAYIVDDRGALRQHVNVFVGKKMVSDRGALSDPVQDGETVYVFQALSGG